MVLPFFGLKVRTAKGFFVVAVVLVPVPVVIEGSTVLLFVAVDAAVAVVVVAVAEVDVPTFSCVRGGGMWEDTSPLPFPQDVADPVITVRTINRHKIFLNVRHLLFF